MKKLNMKNATKRYNKIMMSICCEHCTIGTRFSEGTDNWNLRDMVSEADYWLSCYYEDGNDRHDMKYEDEYGYKAWLSEKGKLERFINTYKPFITDTICNSGHCSNYDN